jgi:hypothetical protein
MTYSYNSLLQRHDQVKTWLERVPWIDPNSKDVLCLRIQLKTPDSCDRPFLRTKDALDDAVAKGDARVLENDPFLRPTVDPDFLSKKMMAQWEKDWKSIKDIVADPRKMVNHRNRRTEISKTARENHMNRWTIYRLLWKYWKGGQTQQCLLPDYRQCGGKTR